MSRARLLLLACAVLVMLCGGISIGAVGAWLAYQEQQARVVQEVECLAARQAAREQWIAAIAVLAEHTAQQQAHREAQQGVRERAALVRDQEALDAAEGDILTTDNRLTSLTIAIDTAEEMQTALIAQPTEAVLQKAALLADMSRDAAIAEVLSPPLTATLALEGRCL